MLMSKWYSCFLIGLVVSTSACVSGERRIADVLQTFPHPDGVTLLYDLTEQGQGSQDACFVTFFYGLYGTDNAFEEAAEFYEEHLVADGWERVYPDWRPNNGLFFERRPGFYLSIETDVRVSHIPQGTIKTAQANYDTLYLIVITYRDWIARTRC
jgi:predicted alpha/beta-fold hydrolase